MKERERSGVHISTLYVAIGLSLTVLRYYIRSVYHLKTVTGSASPSKIITSQAK